MKPYIVNIVLVRETKDRVQINSQNFVLNAPSETSALGLALMGCNLMDGWVVNRYEVIEPKIVNNLFAHKE